ncbi:hypothetical protein, conserved, partial [Eimeria tenella]
HDIFDSFQEAALAALDLAEDAKDKRLTYKPPIVLEGLAAAATLLGAWIALEPSEHGSKMLRLLPSICSALKPQDAAPLLPALLAFSPDDWADRDGALDLLLSLFLNTPGAIEGASAGDLGCLCSSLLAAAFLSPLVEDPYKRVLLLQQHKQQLQLLQQQLAAAAGPTPATSSSSSSSSSIPAVPQLPPCPFPLPADVGPLAATPAAELCVRVGVSVHQALSLLLSSSSSSSAAAAAAVAGASGFSPQILAQVAALQQQLLQEPKPFLSVFGSSSSSSSKTEVRRCFLWAADASSCCAALVGLRCNAAELQQIVPLQQQEPIWGLLLRCSTL